MPTSLSTPQTLPTGYTDTATLGPIENLEKIVWQNTGGVVVFQCGRLDPSGRPVFDQTEAALPPGIWGFDQIYGIRFRSRDVAALATLDPCTGYFQDDPDPFNPGTVPGSTAAITGAVNIQHNDGLVASQPTLDFEDSPSASFAWAINNDGPNTRVKITPPDVATSVFGRIGAVTAQTGDYVAAQITNAADKSSGSTQLFTSSVFTPSSFTNAIGSPTGAGLNAGGVLQVSRPGPTTPIFTATQPGDTTDWRFSINSEGRLNWGSGAGASDANLYRDAANSLSTDDRFRVNSNSGLMVIAAANQNTLTNFLANGDTSPSFKIFPQGAMTWGAGGVTPADIEIARIVNSSSGTGSFLEIINGDGFGYGTGTGGAVTQPTSFSTGVTLSQPTGKITLFTSAISGGLLISFTVTNTKVGINDTVILSGDNMAGIIMSASVANGSFVISWFAPSALASATRKINFAVIKGAVA